MTNNMAGTNVRHPEFLLPCKIEAQVPGPLLRVPANSKLC